MSLSPPGSRNFSQKPQLFDDDLVTVAPVRSNFTPTGPKYLDSKFEKLRKNNAPFLPQKLFLNLYELLLLNIGEIKFLKVILAYASLGRHHGAAVPHETSI